MSQLTADFMMGLQQLRALEARISRTDTATNRELWRTLKTDWEDQCKKTILISKEYFATNPEGDLSKNIPSKAEFESWIRALHMRIKSIFEKADLATRPASPSPPVRKQHSDLIISPTADQAALFSQFDQDASGYIEVDELSQMLKNLRIELNEENTYLLLRRIDQNSDGKLTFTEFRELLKVLSWFRKMFREADADNSGSISRDELEALMKKMNFTFSPIVFTLFEQIFDVDKSGTIDYQEFFTLILYLRELEETFEKQGEVSDWAKALLGPRATAEDVRELQQKVSWAHALKFDDFVKIVCSKKAQIQLQTATTRPQRTGSQVVMGSHPPLMKGVPVSASSPDIKQLLGEPSIPPVGNLSVEQWSKAPTRPLIRWPDQSASVRSGWPNAGMIKREHDTVELGDQQGSLDVPSFVLEDDHLFKHFYRDNLYNKCQNFIGYSEELGHVIISVEETKLDKAKVLIRHKKSDDRLVMPISRNILDSLISLQPQLATCNIYPVKDTDLDMDLLAFEEKLITKNYKFGILSQKNGQTEEGQWYNNEKSSPELEEFLEWLATRVKLQGWNRFRGGLNTRSNLTGTESFYTVFRGFEIMFHISTYIPYTPNDPQQVERKIYIFLFIVRQRHLGNDVVILCFQDPDCTTPFDITKIQSHFNHLSKPTPHYHISFAARPGVPPFGPVLPAGGSYPRTDKLREFLLTKLINGERAAMHAPDFRGKHINTRKMMLKDIADKYQPTKESKLEGLKSAGKNIRGLFRRAGSFQK